MCRLSSMVELVEHRRDQRSGGSRIGLVTVARRSARRNATGGPVERQSKANAVGHEIKIGIVGRTMTGSEPESSGH